MNRTGFVNILAFVIAMMNACAAFGQAEPQPAQETGRSTQPVSVIAQKDMRRVEVVLHFVTGGLEIPSAFVPMLSGSGKRQYPGVRTGPFEFRLVGDYPADTEKVFVHAWEFIIPDSKFTSPPPFAYEARLEALQEMFTRFSLGWPETVTLVAGQAAYEMTITLVPAITVTGKFVASNGEGMGAFMYRQGSMNLMQNVRASKYGFYAYGVPKGQRSWIATSSTDGRSLYRLMHLTEAQTQADLALGTITLIQEKPDGLVDIHAINPSANAQPPSDENESISMVSSDGTHVIDVAVIGGYGRLETEPEPTVPAGYPQMYFVVPSKFVASPLVHKVIGYLRDGRSAELIAAGIPTITPVAGQTTPFTLDISDVLAKMNALP